MHSHDIKRLLELKKNLVTNKEYFMIISSPQIDHIKYEDDIFKIWTTDGYKFELRINNENKS